MNKIDHRKHYFLVFDTETANGLDCPLVYDFGWVIVDKYGNVYKRRSFINREIFFLEKELMQSSYYVEKLPLYYKRIARKETVVANYNTIRRIFLEDIAEYKIAEVVAHNARFDYLSTNNTLRWLTKSKYRYFIPKDIEILDTLKMARSVIGQMPTYRKFCEENGYTYGKNNNQLRFTAEVLYQFITKDLDFIEEHTGLSDVLIEKDILAYCYRQHKPMKKKLWGE